MKPRPSYNDLWPRQRKYAKPAYSSEADREYAARVKANKQKKSAQAWVARKKAEAEALRTRNAEIIASNARYLKKLQDRENQRFAEMREKAARAALALRLKEARAKARSAVHRRMLQQRIATPKWANKGAVMAVYAKAARMQASTGIKHQVDHVVPLVHRLVCGLHCEQNLQVLTKKENLRKLNTWWPDMP